MDIQTGSKSVIARVGGVFLLAWYMILVVLGGGRHLVRLHKVLSAAIDRTIGPRKKMVVGFMIDQSLDIAGDGIVLLIRKNKPIWQAGALNGVGGKVEAGEAPVDAMTREFYEEAGVHTHPATWRLYSVLQVDNPEKSGKAEIYFYVSFVHKSIPIKQMESEPLEWHAVSDIPHLHTVDNL